MRSLFTSLFSYFLSPAGVILLAALDSSLIFFLPLGIDFVVIILSARSPEWFWLYALLATVGSIVGAGVTFWIGRKAGDHGIGWFMKPSTLRRVRERVSDSAAITIPALGLIPPPFPFTAFVLTSGACHANPWTFFTTLAGVRALRFLIEAGLAAYYGRGILSWMQSTTFTVSVTVIAVLAVVGTIVSAVTVYRAVKREKRAKRA